jgi:hypothetical protein
MASFRIPYPSDRAQPRNLDKQQWGVLLNSIFPGATSEDSILNAWDLAKVRGLDVFAGHVAIVSQRRKVEKDWVNEESCWLTLKALVFTAHRTAAFAGIDPIKFGPMVERIYTGFRRSRGEANEETAVSINVPEYVTATVYRFVAGQRCAFSETLFFDEAVPLTQGMPTTIWAKKPALMLAKCAKAAALRIGFAECDYSADEMDGQEVVPDLAPGQTTPLSGAADQDRDAGLQGPEAPQEPAMGGEFGDPVSEFGHLPATTLKWLDRTVDAAINIGAFDEAIANVRSTLNADSHDLGERLIEAAQTIAGHPKASRIWEYIGQARGLGGEAFDTAMTKIADQAEAGKMSKEASEASCTVLTFQKALQHA